MRYHYRCGGKNSKRKCQKRFTLPKRKEDYIRPPKCPACGSTYIYETTKAVKKDRKNNGLCRCDGVPWSAKGGPHRKGSSVWCIHHPTGPTDEDYRERYG